MKKNAKPAPRKIRMTQRVSQKNTMKYVVAGSSILGCILAALVIINFSSNETTFASQQQLTSKVNYRSVETRLEDRMILPSEEVHKIMNQDYKGKATLQTARIPSRASDIVIKQINDAITE